MRVRISIGNLAPIVVSKNGYSFPIGILNSGAYKKGRRLIQPIGGAAKLTEKGRELLKSMFGAKEFHKDDARFIADDRYLNEIFALFSLRDPSISEIDPVREIQDELSANEFPANEHFRGILPPLTVEEAARVSARFIRTVVQPFSDEPGTSPLAGKEPNRRMFHLFEFFLEDKLYFKIHEWEAFFALNAREVATTDGGREKGETRNGDAIADNFILP